MHIFAADNDVLAIYDNFYSHKESLLILERNGSKVYQFRYVILVVLCCPFYNL